MNARTGFARLVLMSRRVPAQTMAAMPICSFLIPRLISRLIPRLSRVALYACVLGCLAACATAPQTSVPTPEPEPAPTPVVANADRFQAVDDLPSRVDLLGLSASQKAAFVEYFDASERAETAPHHRLKNYLLDHLEGFEYLGDTLSASDALTRREGNCMSLAALTLALAEAVDLDIDFQMVNAPPVFDRDERTLISSNHVRSRVYKVEPESRMTIVRGHVLIDYFPDRDGVGGRSVTSDEFVAMMYRNLAAEAMLDDRIDLAFALNERALAHYPDQPDALNLMAVLHRRVGDPDTAERYYHYISAVHGDRVDALNNLASLLRGQGRSEEAARLDSRIARLPDPNPFQWLELGQRFEQRGALERALRAYDQALERAPYLHEAHWRKSLVYWQLGRHHQSLEALREAKSLAHRSATRGSYLAKLDSLKRDNPDVLH